MSNPSVDPNLPLMPSVLDRLLDDRPDELQDRPGSQGQKVAALRDAVRRDLEALLNNRRRCISPPRGMDELEKSVVEYGIPDFLSANMGLQEVREQFRSAIERVIQCYEPRFISLAVELLDDPNRLDRTLRFRIDAVMYAEPAPERVIFNSRLDPSNLKFSVDKAM